MTTPPGAGGRSRATSHGATSRGAAGPTWTARTSSALASVTAAGPGAAGPVPAVARVESVLAPARVEAASVPDCVEPVLARTRVESVPIPWLGIGLIALVAVAVELAVSGRYGYVRDELYFLAAGQHLALGYVDQPVLTPLLARLGALAGGNSLVGLRVIPALITGALVVVTAAISRRLGAGRTGQLVAALAAATCAQYLGAGHELTTAPLDFLCWAVTLYLVVRLLASGDPRWWLAVGLVIGVGSEAKWNIGFLAAALAVGFLTTGARRLLLSRYLVAGCVVAAAFAAPDLIWQAAHGWPALRVFAVLQQSAGHNRATYWVAQVVFTGLVLTPVWLTGLVWTLRAPAARRFRAAGVACAVVVVLQFVLGGKPYYPAGAYTFLLAAGSVPVGRWLAERCAWTRVGAAAALLGSAVITLPVALPVLPARLLRTVQVQKINYDLGEEIGWPQEVALVAREYRALPPARRRATTVLAGNYGEAGALARFGPADGLPTAYSGANNFWLWGPPPRGDVDAIAVNVDPALLRREFSSVRLVATFRNELGVSDDEEGVQIYTVTGLRGSWAQSWLAFRAYG